MELHQYLFSLVLYHHPAVDGLDFTIGTVAGSDVTEEWIYTGFPGGIRIVEDYLGEPVDIGDFWEKHILLQVFSEDQLIDKYFELKDHEDYFLYEPLIRPSYSAQVVAKTVEKRLKSNAFILPDNELRFAAVREIATSP